MPKQNPSSGIFCFPVQTLKDLWSQDTSSSGEEDNPWHELMDYILLTCEFTSSCARLRSDPGDVFFIFHLNQAVLKYLNTLQSWSTVLACVGNVWIFLMVVKNSLNSPVEFILMLQNVEYVKFS